MRRFWRAIEILAWAGFFALAVGALVLRYWLLPNVERYRDEIVARVAAAVGQPVQIGGIEAGWHGLRPHIGLRDVRIYDAAGREALVLPAVDNIISWRSLAYRDLRLHTLVIDGPRLAVRRDAAGVLYVAGIKLSGAEADPAASDWLLGQEEIEIRNAEIEWHDEKRGAPPLVLTQLSLRLRNAGSEHALGLSARPPAELGTGLELRARLAGRSVADIDEWSGRVFLELGYTDLAAWRAWVDYPVEVRRGHGALRLWMTLERGEARAATADVALARLHARLGGGLAPLELAAVQGRLNARLDGGAYELAGRALALAAEQGPKMQPTDFQLRWQPGAADRAEKGTLEATLLELEPLAQLAESLPLPEELRKLVAELKPRGRVSDARLDWQGSLAEPERFTARGRFAELATRPRGALPGFAGMTGSLEATESAGRVHLLANKAALELPDVLPAPLGFDTLLAQLDWERSGAGHVVRLSGGQFASAHFAGSAAGSWSTPGSGRGSIDLTASLARADASQVARYLPHPAIVGLKAHEWLSRAIVAGTVTEAQLRLRGELADFPFVNPLSGMFSVSARFKDGVLDYFDGWPRIHDIEGQLLFEREKMEVLGRSGTLSGARLGAVRVAIPSLDARSPLLTITGHAEGQTADFLRFIQTSPVRRMTDGLADAIGATGRGRLQLRIDLPLDSPAPARVAGDYDFSQNNLTVQERLPAIERASGRVSFTDSGFALHDVRGRLFGGAVAISGGSRPGGAIEVLARGEAQVAALGSLFEHPWQSRLSGAAPYTAGVSLREGLTRISIESSLRGVGIALPPPLDKQPADALPLRVDVIPVEGGARERVSVVLGRIAAAEFLRRRQGDEAISTRRAAIWLTPAPEQAVRLPERPGTLIYGSLAELDLDRWMPLFSSEDAAAAAAAFDVSFGVLDIHGKRLTRAALKAGADAAGWSASVQAEELAGRLSYRKEGGGHLVARLAHFTLPPDSPAPRAQGTLRPSELPGLDLVADKVVFRGKELGRVELAASRAGEDWRIDRISAVNPDSSFTGKGVWASGAGGPPRSTISYELKTSDAGRFLDRVGYKDLVKGGKAELQGTLSWLGEPSSLDYPSLSGTVKLDAENGQFLEIEPGIGKLIALMSMQQFFKRITLDFRDVFSKGFQFDRIEAAARIERGVMELKERDFRMRGSAAEVEMSGVADIARETQNLKVRVVPSLSGSATTVVTIVNPIAGVAAAIAQNLLRNPLGQIFAYDYSVTGSWSDPKVAKLSTAPAPAPAPEQARP